MVRDHQGLWTEDWDALCAEMGAFQKPVEKAVLRCAAARWGGSGQVMSPTQYLFGVGRRCGLGQKKT